MNVDVATDFRADFKRLSLEGQGQRVALAAMRGMQKLVPVDTGLLQRSPVPSDMKVTYPVGYASYAYDPPRGRIHTYPNPTATARWAEVYGESGMPEVVEEVSRIVAGN